MDLEYALLGLIGLHKGATGYELNRIIKESTGRMLSTSLSQIYPALKRMSDRGFVTFTLEPMKNRPDKKSYQITPAGEKYLQAWLEEPIQSGLDFEAFTLKMAFSPLMPKAVILRHIDREIAHRESLLIEPNHNLGVETEYLDKQTYDPSLVNLFWKPMEQVYIQMDQVWINWLVEWRKQIEKNLKY
jgi:DNA-binding PadR family transcriptional regulator